MKKTIPGRIMRAEKVNRLSKTKKRGYCLSGKGSLIAEGSDTSFFGRILD
jgi:hypothetical protein